MNNENTVQNNSVLPATGGVLDSPTDIQVTTEEPVMEEPAEEETAVETVAEELTEGETTEETSSETEVPYVVETIDYSEILAEIKSLQEQSTVQQELISETYTEINTTLHHLDSVAEYGVCLLIIVLIIALMKYAYKFFKMFF